MLKATSAIIQISSFFMIFTSLSNGG
jgi:hypothetical protein